MDYSKYAITSSYVDKKMKELRELASKYGYTIRFIRHKSTIEDEFVIFLYNKKIQSKGYVVGYDGYWGAAPQDMSHFDMCVSQAANRIVGITK